MELLHHMASVLQVTFPFFALILCGYLACRFRILPVSSIPGLNSYVLFFALPCMLYRFGAGTSLGQLFQPAAALIYISAALLLIAVSIEFSLRHTRQSRNWNDAAFGGLVATFPNTGFMGLPLLVSLLGKQAASPVILCILIDMVLSSSLCLALSRLDKNPQDADQKSWFQALSQSLSGVLRNPMPWAILLGLVAAYWGWQPPTPINQTIHFLADSASPVALFTIGAMLARSQLQTTDSVSTGQARPFLATNKSDYLPIALFKLFLHPLLIYVLGLAVFSLGAPYGLTLSAFDWKVLVLTAALPSASNVSLLAERYAANTNRIAHIILSSTLLSFLSFSFIASILA